jgi:hypothetical protein
MGVLVLAGRQSSKEYCYFKVYNSQGKRVELNNAVHPDELLRTNRPIKYKKNMSKVHPSKHISDIPPESLISQKSSAVLSLCVFTHRSYTMIVNQHESPTQ